MEFRKVLLGAGIAPVIAGAALFGGCGGDDDGGGGSEEDFVADLCGLLKDFTTDLDNLDPNDLANEDDAFDALAEPFETLAADFEDLNPPSELEDWHEQGAETLNEIAQKLRDGDFEFGDLEDDPLPDLPDDVQERYTSLAEGNEDCEEAGVTLGEE